MWMSSMLQLQQAGFRSGRRTSFRNSANVTYLLDTSVINIKTSQQPRGLPLDESDPWIAATSVTLGATLVGRNSDFQRVPGLTVVEQ